MSTANYEYSRSNRENLLLPTQNRLSKNQLDFLQYIFSDN